MAEGSRDFYARFWSTHTIYIVSTPTCFVDPSLCCGALRAFPACCVLRAAPSYEPLAFCPAEGPPPPPPPCPPGLHRSRRKKPVCFFAPFPLSALFSFPPCVRPPPTTWSSPFPYRSRGKRFLLPFPIELHLCSLAATKHRTSPSPPVSVIGQTGDSWGNMGFASCRWPIWQVDDFTRCFQQE